MPADLMFQITIFGGLAFTLVTLVLYTLAHQLGSAIDRHELIRAARMQQHAYLRMVDQRRRGANADYAYLDDIAEADDVSDHTMKLDPTPGSTPENTPVSEPARQAA